MHTVLPHHYSDALHQQKIAVLGIDCPPLGGVSIHINRLIKKLKRQNNNVLFFKTERRWRMRLFPFYLLHLISWLIYHRPTTIIYHSSYLPSSLPEMLFIILFFAGKQSAHVIIVEHDCRHLYQRSHFFIACYKKLMAQVDHLICIGSKTVQSYDHHAISGKSNSIESAFLPPDIDERAKLIGEYPPHLTLFMQNHSPLLIANAFKLILLDNRDLYGIDQAIELIDRLKKDYPPIGLLVLIGSHEKTDYDQSLQKIIQRRHLHDHIFFLRGHYQLWPLLARSDLFLRPTLSDGASVSIEEALFCQVPVIASDVCQRPAAVTLYESENSDDLYYKARTILAHRRSNHANAH